MPPSENEHHILLSHNRSLLLSPSAHMMLSKAYLDLKKENEAEGEKAMGRLILKSILATGKGTKKKPYVVMT